MSITISNDLFNDLFDATVEWKQTLIDMLDMAGRQNDTQTYYIANEKITVICKVLEAADQINKTNKKEA